MTQENNAVWPVAPSSSDMPTRAGGDSAPYAPPADVRTFLQPPVEKDEIGRLGGYRILSLLGMGGMGMVFLAEDLSLGRRVALKVMKPELSREGGKEWQRFLHEARAMARIKDDHLITIYQIGQEGDTVYFVMELLQGETLEAWLNRTIQPEVAEIARIGREIAQGLDAIHEAGLVHRDIKPANLWIEDNNGRVKILDFGLARSVEDDTHLTATGMLIGTPAFLSPEQARGKPAEARSDLFSLGCVLYQMCTRQLPFQAENTLEQLAALASQAPPPIQLLNGTIPDDLNELIMELLAKAPEDRPESAQAVAERLLQIKRAHAPRKRKQSEHNTQKIEKPSGNRKAPATKRQPQSHQQRPLFAYILAASIFLVSALLGTILFLTFGNRPDPLAGGPTAPTSARDPQFQLPPTEFGNLLSKETPRQPSKGSERPGSDKQVPLVRVYLADLPKAEKVNWPFHKPPRDRPPPPDGPQPPPEGKLPPGVGGPVEIRGERADHGLWMHPAPPMNPEGAASITYKLGRQYRVFAAHVTLNDSGKRSPSPLTFRLWGDGKLFWKSEPVRTQDDGQNCQGLIVGVDLLKLEVLADGDVRGAHAVWVNPFVAK